MTRLLTDSFTEGADRALTAHSPDLGGAWSIFSAATMTVVAAEGRVRGSDTINAAIAYNAAANVANVAVAATVRRTSATINEGNPGVLARLQTGGDNRYLAYHSGSALTLFKRVAGVTTVLGSAAPAFAVGADATIELQVNGADLTVLWNGTPEIAASDTAIAGAGYAGLTMRQNGRVDDVSADTIAWVLASADGPHALSSDGAVLGVAYALAPAPARHDWRAPPAVLGVAYPLSPAASCLPLSGDGPTLRRGLTPPGIGLVAAVAADPRGMPVAQDSRTEEIDHG